MTSLARSEREAMLELMAERGPHAPTLCAGWTTHDLAAHLYVRERQPLSVPGYVVGALQPASAWFERRARTTAYEDLLARLRRGPRVLSPVGSPVDAVYDLTNLHEFYVHHEDVRRANGLGPRALDRALEDALWARAGLLAPVFLRRAPGRVRLVTPGAQELVTGRGDDETVVRGRPGELFLFLWGRPADVVVEGTGLEGPSRRAVPVPVGAARRRRRGGHRPRGGTGRSVTDLREALQRYSGRAFLLGLAGALLLAVPDLLRQLPVRDGSGGLPAALLVDVVGVLCAAVLQVALIGLLNGGSGVRLLLSAVRRSPGVLLAGMALAGAVSALLTLVPSVALLGYGQVLGPLQDPPLRSLVLAQLSDVAGTAVTAPWFALLVGVLSGRGAPQPAGRP